LVAAALIAALLVACNGNGGGGGGDNDRAALEKALQAMVLQTTDLPAGFEQSDSRFSTNDEASGGNAERKDLLDSWGRELGLDVTFSPQDATGEAANVRGIEVSASLYDLETGAVDSFADAQASAEGTDWTTTYAGLRDFRKETVDAIGRADQIGWLRFSGFQPANTPPDALVTDDLIYFRIGRERGFLRVLGSSTETADRAYLHDTIDGLLTKLLQRVRDGLETSGG
jgi:hypothetical protein